MPFILNKKKTPMIIKVFAAIVAFSFVAGMVWFAISPFVSESNLPIRGTPTISEQERAFMTDAKMYENIVSENTTDTTSWASLGDTYFNWGSYLISEKKDKQGAAEKWMKAINAYGKALELKPENDIPIKNNLGVLYFYLGNIELAKKEWQEVLSKESTNAQALFNMGLLYKSTNNTTEALNYFNKFLELYPGDPNASQARAYVRELKKKK